MVKNLLPKSLIFILGCQRSGTTWLANIFDASPETLLFMEPFAPAYKIFPEFPEANFFIETLSPSLEKLLKNDFPSRLLYYKTFLFRQSLSQPSWFKVDRWLANQASRIPYELLRARARKFQLLNLNRFDADYPIYPKKKDPTHWIVKELRLAGKIPILLQAFPKAFFIVILRHPCAVVDSMLKWFKRGNLNEIQLDLETYLEKIEVQKFSSRYQNLINKCRSGGLPLKVALYWRISYETMVEKLEKHKRSQIIVYEQLALNPKETIENILSEIDISRSQSITEYLSYSTNRENTGNSPISTIRKTANVYQSWTNNTSEEVRKAVQEIVGDSFLMPYFEPYYSSTKFPPEWF